MVDAKLKLISYYIKNEEADLAERTLASIPVSDLGAQHYVYLMKSLPVSVFEEKRLEIIKEVLNEQSISVESARQLTEHTLTDTELRLLLTWLVDNDDSHQQTAERLVEHSIRYPENPILKPAQLRDKLRDLKEVGVKLELLAKCVEANLFKLTKIDLDGLKDKIENPDAIRLLAAHLSGSGQEIASLVDIKDFGKKAQLISIVAEYDQASAVNLAQEYKSKISNPAEILYVLNSMVNFADRNLFSALVRNFVKRHDPSEVSFGSEFYKLLQKRERNAEEQMSVSDVRSVIAWMHKHENNSADIIECLKNLKALFPAVLNRSDLASLNKLNDLSKPNAHLIGIAIAVAKQEWDVVRKITSELEPKSCGGAASYLLDIKTKALVAPWQSYQNKQANSVIHSASSSEGFEALFPSERSEVLLLCERGADPAPVLSSKTELSFIHCSMDSLDKSLAREHLELWSLRDLFPDTDPKTTKMYMDCKRVSEKLIQRYLALQMQHNMRMGPEYFNRVLSIGLEDSLMGSLLMAGCFFNALERYEGENVIIAQNSGETFELFASSFLKLNKNYYFNNSGLRAAKNHKKLMNLAKTWRAPAKIQTTEVDVTEVFDAYDTIDICKPIKELPPQSNRPAIAFMGFFNDPIYIGNIIPLLRSLIKKYDIYVVEANNALVAHSVLIDEFGENLIDQDTKNKIHLVDMVNTLKGAYVDPRLTPAHFDRLADELVAGLEKSDMKSGEIELDKMLVKKLPSLLRIVTARAELSFRFLEALFNTISVKAMYVCSERLNTHMCGVAVANKFGIPTIDVMAVNSIRLPRYKAPAARYCTAIDTLTAEYFQSFYGLPNSRIAITGSPRLDEMLRRYHSADEDEILKMLNIPKGKKIILLVSQLQPIDRYIDIFEQTIRAAKEDGDAYIIVKLHRRENYTREEIYRRNAKLSGLGKKIRIIRDEPILRDIENCLKVSKVVISMYSNVLREAACVGIPIIIADYFNTELPFDYVSSGIGVAAKAPDELVEYTLKFLNGDLDPTYQFRNENYFKSNPQLLSSDSADRITNII